MDMIVSFDRLAMTAAYTYLRPQQRFRTNNPLNILSEKTE
jgi:hypothetical protein